MNFRMKLCLLYLLVQWLSIPVHLYDPKGPVFCAANNHQCPGEFECIDGLCACPRGLVASSDDDAQADCPKCVPFTCTEDVQCVNVFRNHWDRLVDYYNCSCEAPEGESIHEPSSTPASIASIDSQPRTCTFKAQLNISLTERVHAEKEQQQAEARLRRRQNDFLSESFFAMIVWGFGVVIIGMLLVSIVVDRLKQCIYPNHKLIKEYSPKP